VSLAALTRLELGRVGWVGYAVAVAWGLGGPRALGWVPAAHQALVYRLLCVAVLLVLASRLRASEATRSLDAWLAGLPLGARGVFLARAAALALAAAGLALGALVAGQPPLATLVLAWLGWGAGLWLAPWRALAAPLLLGGALLAAEVTPRVPATTGWGIAAGVGGALALWAWARASLRDPSQGVLQGLVHPATRRAFSRHAWSLCALLAVALVVRQAEPAAAGTPFVGARVTVLDEAVNLSAPAAQLGEARDLLAGLQGIPAAVAKLLGLEAPPARAYALVPAATPPGPGRLRLGVGVSPARQLAEHTARELLGARLGELDRLDSRQALREGLVRYVTWRVTDGDPLPARTHVAVAHARRPFGLDELFDLGTLDATRGVQVAGTLGEVWIATLVDEYGDEVIPKLLSAARPGVHWPQALDAMGVDLEELELNVLRTIESVADDPRAHVDLPRLFALDDQADHPELQLVAVPDRAIPRGWQVVCRARFSGEPAVDALPLGPSGSGTHRFHVPGAPMWGPRPAVQLGLRALRSGDYPETIWEEWASPPSGGF